MTVGGVVAALAALAIVVYAGFPSTVVRMVEWAQRRQAGLTLRSIATADGVVPYLDGGSGPVVLLLHGYQDQKASMVALAGQLTGALRVVIPDLHGFGENYAATNGDYRPAAQARRLHDFVAALGLDTIDLAGVSMGGEIAGVYAASYPGQVRTLALMSAAGVRPDTISPLGQRLLAGDDVFHVVDRRSLDTLIALISDSTLRLPDVVRRAMLAEYHRRNPQWDSVFRQLIEPDVRDQLDSLAPVITARTLVLWGARDPLFPVSAGRRLAARMPAAEFVVLPDCGHLCAGTRAAEVARAYRAFRLSAGSSGATKSASVGGRKITSSAR